MDADRIIFTPDYNLAMYVQSKTDKEIIPVPLHGNCPTHHQITKEDIMLKLEEYPESLVMAHPECNMGVLELADYIESTEGMVNVAKKERDKTFIIATEVDMIYRLKKDAPHNRYIPASGYVVCPDMKSITAEKVRKAIKENVYEVEVEERIRKRAVRSIERMFEITR